MSDQPVSGEALRGAVDLSGLGNRSAGRSGGAPAAGGVPEGLVVEGTDSNFQQVVEATTSVPAVVVLWSGRQAQSADYLRTVVDVAVALEGALQVVSIDVEANPGLAQAFQAQQVPVTIGLVQGQPVPLFAGAQPAQQVRAYVDELLKLAAQHGVTGRLIN